MGVLARLAGWSAFTGEEVEGFADASDDSASILLGFAVSEVLSDSPTTVASNIVWNSSPEVRVIGGRRLSAPDEFVVSDCTTSAPFVGSAIS